MVLSEMHFINCRHAMVSDVHSIHTIEVSVCKLCFRSRNDAVDAGDAAVILCIAWKVCIIGSSSVGI